MADVGAGSGGGGAETMAAGARDIFVGAEDAEGAVFVVGARVVFGSCGRAIGSAGAGSEDRLESFAVQCGR
jgi:hypothetical protein